MGTQRREWLIILGGERDHVRRVLKDEQDFAIWRVKKAQVQVQLA